MTSEGTFPLKVQHMRRNNTFIKTKRNKTKNPQNYLSLLCIEMYVCSLFQGTCSQWCVKQEEELDMLVVSRNIKNNWTEKQSATCALLSQGHALTQYCLKVVHVVFKYLNTHLPHTCNIFSKYTIIYVALIRKRCQSWACGQKHLSKRRFLEPSQFRFKGCSGV